MRKKILLFLLIFSLLPIPQIQAQTPPKSVVVTVVNDEDLIFKRGENTVREFTLAFENVEDFNVDRFNQEGESHYAKYVKVKEIHPKGYVHPMWETQMQGVNIAPLDKTRFITFEVTGTEEFLNMFTYDGGEFEYKFHYGSIVGLHESSPDIIYDLNRDGVDDLNWETVWNLPVNGTLYITIPPSSDPMLPPPPPPAVPPIKGFVDGSTMVGTVGCNGIDGKFKLLIIGDDSKDYFKNVSRYDNITSWFSSQGEALPDNVFFEVDFVEKNKLTVRGNFRWDLTHTLDEVTLSVTVPADKNETGVDLILYPYLGNEPKFLIKNKHWYIGCGLNTEHSDWGSSYGSRVRIEPSHVINTAVGVNVHDEFHVKYINISPPFQIGQDITQYFTNVPDGVRFIYKGSSSGHFTVGVEGVPIEISDFTMIDANFDNNWITRWGPMQPWLEKWDMKYHSKIGKTGTGLYVVVGSVDPYAKVDDKDIEGLIDEDIEKDGEQSFNIKLFNTHFSSSIKVNDDISSMFSINGKPIQGISFIVTEKRPDRIKVKVKGVPNMAYVKSKIIVNLPKEAIVDNVPLTIDNPKFTLTIFMPIPKPKITTWIKGLDILGYKNEELGEFLFGVILEYTPGGIIPISLPDIGYNGTGDDYLKGISVGDDITSWISSTDPQKSIPNGIKFRIEDVKKNMFIVRAYGVPETVTGNMGLKINIPADKNTTGKPLDVLVWDSHNLTLEVKEKKTPPVPPVDNTNQDEPENPLPDEPKDEPKKAIDKPIPKKKDEPKKEIEKTGDPTDTPTEIKKEYSLLRGEIVENIKDNIIDKLPQKYKDLFERDKNKYSEFIYLIGYPDGSFKLENVISKQELAEVLSRILTGFKRGDLQLLDRFTDEIPTWSSSSVASLLEIGLYDFIEDFKFNPKDLVDWNYFNKLKDEIIKELN